MAKNTKKYLVWIDYGEVEGVLVAYKLGRITLEEAKRILRVLTK